MASGEPVLSSDDGGVRLLTLNRPEARNALDTALMEGLAAALRRADADAAVHAIVLTGADPAFCAGLDLKELGSTGANLAGTGREGNPFSVLAGMETPVIGAVNGAAVTGGLEIALNCDFLVASERARFADTHARVGVLPGGGMTALLPQAVGLRRAKEMSLTGNFVDAAEALRIGLVNRVVAHADLVPTASAIAADVAGNDRDAVLRLRRNYDRASAGTVAEALRLEREEFAAWPVRFDEVERRRAGIVQRGRAQAGRADSSPGDTNPSGR